MGASHARSHHPITAFTRDKLWCHYCLCRPAHQAHPCGPYSHYSLRRRGCSTILWQLVTHWMCPDTMAYQEFWSLIVTHASQACSGKHSQGYWVLNWPHKQQTMLQLMGKPSELTGRRRTCCTRLQDHIMMTGINSLRVLILPTTSPSKQALATHLSILSTGNTRPQHYLWLFPVLLLKMSLLRNLQLGWEPSLTKQRNT